MERPFLILYASETGNAIDVAEKICKEALMRGIEARISCMSKYDILKLADEKFVIFVCSTTGDGEEPETMKEFWKFLKRRNLSSQALCNLFYTVFGLGDSSYAKFNYPAKKLFKRIAALGGNVICDRGDGDDQHEYGVEGAFLPFLENLWRSLEQILNTKIEKVLNNLPSKYKFTATTSTIDDDLKHSFQVLSNNRITSNGHFQDVRHLIVQSSSAVEFNPGDISIIKPVNSDEDVNWIMKRFNWKDIVFLIEPNRSDATPLKQSVLRLSNLIKYEIDIFSCPTKSFFESILPFVTAELEKEKIEEFLSLEGINDTEFKPILGLDDFYRYTLKSKRTVIEVLSDFKSFMIPVDYIFDVFKLIKPRSYSICNALGSSKTSFEMTYSVVDYKNPLLVKPREGYCTRYLKTLNALDTPNITIKKGTLNLKDQVCILVATGTGIAPIRSFIQSRFSNPCSIETWLFFGCRFQQKDHLFGDEFLNLSKQNPCFKYFPVFSRDSDKKRYVQDKILELKDQVINLINNQGASIFICGNKQLPDSIIKVLNKSMGLNTDELIKDQRLTWESW